jgi:hypothetical protein
MVAVDGGTKHIRLLKRIGTPAGGRAGPHARGAGGSQGRAGEDTQVTRRHLTRLLPAGARQQLLVAHGEGNASRSVSLYTPLHGCGAAAAEDMQHTHTHTHTRDSLERPSRWQRQCAAADCTASARHGRPPQPQPLQRRQWVRRPHHRGHRATHGVTAAHHAHRARSPPPPHLPPHPPPRHQRSLWRQRDVGNGESHRQTAAAAAARPDEAARRRAGCTPC